MNDRVAIFEVSPRDGLQNEKRFVPTSEKIELIDRLSECGLSRIEVTSFVSPKWVPQLADATEVMAGIKRNPAIRYAALAPNLKGYEAAKQAEADEVAIFASASEGFSRRNINCSIAESLERFRPVLEAAAQDEIPVRGYVSCVTDCPFDGPTPPEAVARVSEALLEMGCYQISLGDTIGKGNRETVAAMLETVTAGVPAERLAGHFHDTGGHALENIAVSLEYGLRTFDSAAGGLGGCPYAPGAAGNVDSVSVAEMLKKRGFETGIDLNRLRNAAQFARSLRANEQAV